MLQFYKPNAKCTGSSCTFSFKHEDKAMFASLMKQHSWDSAKRRGSFAGNKSNPKAQVSIKFSLTEAAGIIDCIETNRSLSAYHSNVKQVTKINFTPYIPKGKDEQLGFTLSVNKEAKEDSTDKSVFLIGFNFQEARLLKEYIIHHLGQCFQLDFDNYSPTKRQPDQVKIKEHNLESNNFAPLNEEEEDDIW